MGRRDACNRPASYFAQHARVLRPRAGMPFGDDHAVFNLPASRCEQNWLTASPRVARPWPPMLACSVFSSEPKASEQVRAS